MWFSILAPKLSWLENYSSNRWLLQSQPGRLYHTHWLGKLVEVTWLHKTDKIDC